MSQNDAICFDEQRSDAVRNHPTLNGIDFVEYFENRLVLPFEYWLEVTFLKAAPAGLVGSPDLFRIEGGVRVVGIEVTKVEAGANANQLKVFVSEPGDFSTYTLVIDHSSLDAQLASAHFGFKVGCPSEFDCRQEPECPPKLLAEPALDYLAKDYASFRRLLLDLIPQLNPHWLERNPSDVGMALVELLAYSGDHLSYFQDAVATETYLDTCRQRVSAKRHSRLIDYRMHDGRNAWSFVQIDVSGSGVAPQGTMLLTRVGRPLRGQLSPPGVVVQFDDLDFPSDVALRNVVVFETTARITAAPENNLLYLHTWGNRDCCLARGSTEAHMYTLSGGSQQAIRPALTAGDYLLFEEVKGLATGLEADADPAHRQVVRIISVEDAEDPVFQSVLSNGEVQPVTNNAQPALPLLKVTWREEDALLFPLCISTHLVETGRINNMSIARGNVIPCDHGRTVTETLPPPSSGGDPAGFMEQKLSASPLTFHAAPDDPLFRLTLTRLAVLQLEGGQLQDGRHTLGVAPREAQPAVVLTVDFPAGETEIWTPVAHLLDSHAFDRHFVVDVDNEGEATLRFGDDDYGRRPAGAERVMARYRIGNGRAGNIGRASLVHIVQPAPQDMIDPANPTALLPLWPSVENIRQPLAAQGGADAESIEEVRQLAPRAFQAVQFRAVTEADYEAAAMGLSTVAAAKATFRWTGSWHTVFVAIHPRDPADLITEPGGRTHLTEELARQVRIRLTRYRLAGYDLEIRTAQYVPLEIDIQICVARGHFRGDVLEAVHRALSNRQFADGSLGFFHPTRFAFGESVYLSRLYAAVERVEGVESAVVTLFKRYWEVENDELENGVIPMGDDEIARLDNDPNFPENGVLRLTAVGGL